MSRGPIGTRQEPGRIPLLEEQIATLNQALTREVLRHAETRRKLLAVLADSHAWSRFIEDEGTAS